MSLRGDTTLITGGTFNNALGDLNVIHISTAREERAIKLLYEKIAPGAFHNSAERFDPPKCHPETRKVILKEIMDWIVDVDKKELLIWLYGPAGAGKSAIAQSIAEWCYEEGHLDASFFFSRTAPGRNDDQLFIATLAYQLTTSIPNIRQHVALAVDRDPAIFGRSLQAQMERLILEPLEKEAACLNMSSGDASTLRPIFIIIDGLDECGQSRTQQYILSVLASAVLQSEITLFFLVASRPEQDIRQSFNIEPLTSLTRRIVLDDTYRPDADISIFLTSKFSEIKKNHTLKDHLPDSWPSDSDMKHLIQKSSGQFIYASTVMKFLESSRHRPTERLVIFGLKPPGKNLPFAELDALYMHILSSVQDIEAVTNVLMYLLFFGGEIYNSSDSPPPRVPTDIENFLQYPEGELQIILADLHSIIHMPEPGCYGVISLFHASLGDFLKDKARSGVFFIDVQDAHTRLARLCIKHVTFALSTHFDGRPHIKTSYQELMQECSQAYPTEDLLQDLRNFDFVGFLNSTIRIRYGLSKIGIPTDLPKLLEWIKEQSDPSCENILYTTYIDHFDTFHRIQLSCYPQGPALYHLLAAVTVPGSYGGLDLLYLAMEGLLDSSETQHFMTIDNDILELSLSISRIGYHSLLLAFLTNPARSGIYHIDKSRYVSLAKKCLKCLVRDHSRKNLELEALHLLPKILLLIPSQPELAIYLRDNPIHSSISHQIHNLKSRRDEVSLLINSYIKQCNIPEEISIQYSQEPSGSGSVQSAPIASRTGSRMRKWFKKK